MTIVVEDGTVVSNANSYVSEATLTAFATARNITLTGNTEKLLIQAMDYIDQLEYKGYKYLSTQSLQWPRVDVYIDGYYNNTSHIPQQLKDGLCHCAIAIDQGNDPLLDIERQTKQETVGDISVVYMDSSYPSTQNIKIYNALRKILRNGGQLGVDKG